MKNFLLLLFVGLLMHSMADAQNKTKEKDKSVTTKITPPEAVSSAFQSAYPSVSGFSWSKNYNGNYTVAFVNADNLKESVEFTANGTLVKAKTTYTKESLPEAVTNSLASEFGGAEITEVNKYEIAGITPYYKLKVKKGDDIKEILMNEEGMISE